MEPDNTPLEQRLSQYLGATADGIDVPPGVPTIPIAIANKRRRTRRTVGSSLAAVALIAGGIGAYQLSGDSNGPGIETAAEEELSEEDSAAVDAATEEPAEVDPPGSGLDTSILPISTGPTLDWNEVAAPATWSGGQIVWTGTSFVGLSYGPTGGTVIRSDNGTDWTETSAPSGYDLWGLQASGDTLVVWGSETVPANGDEETPPFFGRGPEASVFTSSDGGATWSSLPALPEVQASTNSPYVQHFTDLGASAVKGDTVIVGVMRHLSFDIEKIAADFGLEIDFEFSGWSQGETELGICLDQNCNNEATFTYEELGLTPEEIEEFSYGGGQTTVMRSVGGGDWELADLTTDGGFTDSIVVANGEFKLSMMSEAGGSNLYSSNDGLTWTLTSSNREMGGLTTDGTNLYAHSWGPDGGLLRSTDGGATWSPITGGSRNVHQAVGGPAGLVVSGELYEQGDYEEFTTASIEKDGYIVNWLEDSLTVVDATTGEVVLEFGPEDMESDETPDTVIEDEDGDSFSLTFLHPETLEPLVVINEDDMAEAFGYDDSGPDEYEQPESFVGWSGDDGQTWGYQTSTDAFGVNGWAQIAVGDGVVVAIVEEFNFDEYDEPAATTEAEWVPATIRVFIANTN